MPDIVTSGAGVFVPAQAGVDSPQLNAIIGNAVIQPSFITGKPVANAPAVTDQILIARANGTYAQITYAALVAGIIGVSAPRGNTIINGDMSRWARQTSFVQIADQTVTAERYKCRAVTTGTGKLTITQQAAGLTASASPFYPHPVYCLRATAAVAQASMGAGDYFAIEQRVAREQAYLVFDQPSSLQLLLRASVTGIYSVTLFNSDSSQRYTQTCNVAVANTWTQFTLPGIAAMPTGSGNWGTADTDWCYTVHIGLASGSTFQSATLGSWQADTKYDATSQVNMMATLNATLDVVFIQHEPGLICSPYQWVTPIVQEMLCQRYYAHSYQYGTFDGAVTANNALYYLSAASGFAIGNVRYPVTMIAAGSFGTTLNIYSSSTGTASRIRDNTAAVDRTVTAVSDIGTNGFSGITATAFSPPSAGSNPIGIFHWSMDAEI